MRTSRLIVAAVLVVAAIRGVPAQQPRGDTAPALEVVTLGPDFYMIAGAGGNIGVNIGPEGAIVVDSGSAAMAPAVVMAMGGIIEILSAARRETVDPGQVVRVDESSGEPKPIDDQLIR